MNSIFALASTGFLGSGSISDTTIQGLERRIPGFAVLQGFFKRWLRIDLDAFLAIFALLGAASSGIVGLQETGHKIYW